MSNADTAKISSVVKMPPHAPRQSFKPPCEGEHLPCSDYYPSLEEQQQENGIVYEGIISAVEASSEAAMFVTAIRRGHKQLRELIVGNEVAVCRYWHKLSISKRKAVLNETAPSLPNDKFNQDLLLKKITTEMALQRRTTFLLSYLNSDKLAREPAALLALAMNNLTVKAEDFRSFDVDHLFEGLRLRAFKRLHSSACILLHDDQRYGHLAAFSANLLHRKDAFPCDIGLLALESRSAVLSMLCNVLEKLIKNPAPSSDSTLSRALVSNLSEGDLQASAPFGYVDGIFVLPKFNFTAACELAELQSQFHKDELFYMTTDVAATLAAVEGLQLCRDAKTAGESHNTCRSDSRHLAPITAYTSTLFTNVCNWHFLAQVFDELRGQAVLHPDFQGHDTTSSAPTASTTKYTTLLRTAYSILENTLHQSLEELRELHFAHPERKRLLRRSFKNEEELSKVDRLSWLIQRLGQDYRMIPRILPELTDLLEQRNQANRVPNVLMNVISELGPLYGLLQQIIYHLPSCPFEVLNFPADQSIRTEYFGAYSKQSLHPAGQDDGSLHAKAKALRVPHHSGQKTIEWLDRVDHAQALLRDIWDCARHVHLATLEEAGLDATGLAHIQSIITTVGAELYHPLSKQEQDRIRNAGYRSAQRVTYGLKEWVPTPQQAEERFIKARKAKAPEPVDAPVSIEPKADELQPASEEPRWIIHLSASNLNMIPHLTSTNQQPQGNKTFKHMSDFLAEAGFEKRSKGGSKYLFEVRHDIGCHAHKSILLHAPHPHSQYSSQKLRSDGARLMRRFGWSAETFQPP